MNKNAKTLIAALVGGLFLLLTTYFNLSSESRNSVAQQPEEKDGLVMVERAIDGDTIELVDGRKVRYIGVDTPETKDPRKEIQCFGKEAYEYNKSLVEGQYVRLEKDVSDKDSFGRLLRYVYIPQIDPSTNTETEIFLNERLVAQGFAHAATYPPDVAQQEVFRAAEKSARDKKLGLWGQCP